MNRKRKGFFVSSLLTFQLILIMLICAALLYVHFLLTNYERCQPERYVEDAAAELLEKAEKGTLWTEYGLPEAVGFEADTDPNAVFAALLSREDTKIAKKAGLTAEDEAVYTLRTADGFSLAEVTLRAVGEPVTKLAVFTWQEWETADVTVPIAPVDYTMTLPEGFTATLNGKALTEGDGLLNDRGGMDYTMRGLLFPPHVEIRSSTGETAAYSVKGDRILPVIYDYDLTLPSSLSLTLDGTPWEGEATAEGYRSYRLLRLTKPEVIISDLYGNEVSYGGESSLPLTHTVIRATDRYSVTVNSIPASLEALTLWDDPDFAPLAEYTTDLPKAAEWEIAVLKSSAEIVVTSPYGKVYTTDGAEGLLDLTNERGAEDIPPDIAAEVDALHIAKQWSLFVSKDLQGNQNGLSEIAKYLIPDSYQYEIAHAYATGTDISFTSKHTMKSPPFSEENAANYKRLSDNCFCVDVYFKKHMILYYGEEIVDTMHERLFFVKYDDPADEGDSPAWKLASMKEIG